MLSVGETELFYNLPDQTIFKLFMLLGILSCVLDIFPKVYFFISMTIICLIVTCEPNTKMLIKFLKMQVNGLLESENWWDHQPKTCQKLSWALLLLALIFALNFKIMIHCIIFHLLVLPPKYVSLNIKPYGLIYIFKKYLISQLENRW